MKNILIGNSFTRYFAGLLLVLAFQPAALAEQLVFKTEPGVDRPGYDISNVELDVADHRACQSLCSRNEECRAYTYVKPGIQGTAARCYLKAKVPMARCNSCCTSGVGLVARQPEPSTPSCPDSNSQAQPAETSRATGLGKTGRIQAAEAVTPTINTKIMQDRPDLVIQKYWTEKDADSGIVYFNWLVQNIGSAHAGESILSVSCKQMGAASCPWGNSPYSSQVRSLAPAKAGLAPEKDFAASEVISLGMDPTTVPVRFVFTAVIDSPGQVSESDESNNQSVNEYALPGQAQSSHSGDPAVSPRQSIKRINPGMVRPLDETEGSTDPMDTMEKVVPTLSGATGPDDGAGTEQASPGNNASVVFSLEVNTNRAGSDYHRVPLDSFDVDMCQAICASEELCHVFTLVKSTAGGSGAMCYLKEELTPPVRDGCCTSGIKINSPDWWGGSPD